MNAYAVAGEMLKVGSHAVPGEVLKVRSCAVPGEVLKVGSPPLTTHLKVNLFFLQSSPLLLL